MGRERVSLLKVSSFQGCPTLERGVSIEIGSHG